MKKLFAIIVLFLLSLVTSCNDEKLNDIDYNNLEPQLITIYLYGEVRLPGEYKVSIFTTLSELISYAGGFLPVFNDYDVDYSIVLYNGQTLTFTNTAEIPNLIKININTATKEQLMSLPNIGEVTATNIINYRIFNGPFSVLEQLLEVSGIGEKKFNEIKNLITI